MICSFAGIFKLILIPRRNLRIPTEFRSEWFEHFLNLSESQNKPIYSDGFRRFRSEFRRNQKIWKNNFFSFRRIPTGIIVTPTGTRTFSFNKTLIGFRRICRIPTDSDGFRSDFDGFRSDTIGFGLFCRLRQMHQRFRRIGGIRRTLTDSDGLRRTPTDSDGIPTES